MKRFTLTVAALCSLGAATISADVINIDEFQGDVTEGFENLFPPGGYPGPMDIMDENATINDQLANTVVIALNLISFDTGFEITPFNGNLMGLIPTGWTEFVFNTPVTRFGGYFGTADNLDGGSAIFYDEQDNVIDTHGFDIEAGQWEWKGWQSDTAIKRVEVFGHTSPGKPLVFDDLRITFVPTPGALALLAIGGIVSNRRRRRA